MTETKRFLIGDAGELIDLKNHKLINKIDFLERIIGGDV